jgi:hypothetical protein
MGDGLRGLALGAQAAALCASTIGVGSRAAATQSPSRELRIELIADIPVPDAAVRVLRHDVVAIWRQAGVTIAWVPPRSAADSQGDGVELSAVLLRAGVAQGPTRRTALAALDFVDGVPDRRIRVFVDRAERLLALARSAHGLPVRLADSNVALSRVLGRSLAHEVGHYVLATTTHADSGLMQATHAIVTLARPDRRPFRLDRVSAARLALGSKFGGTIVPADDCSRPTIAR